MNSYKYVVERASEAVGLKDFNSEGMEGDDFRKVFLALQDAIRSLNSDPALMFGTATVSLHVTSDAILFKPLTDEERAIIDGGGSVSLTDRVIDLRPTVAPMAYINGTRASMVDPLDLPQFQDRYTCAWLPDWDKDVLQFGASVGDLVRLQVRKPVPIPSRPDEQIKIPERFHEYLILTLAVGIGTKLGLAETLVSLKQSLAQELTRVTANNNYSRPVYLDSSMNRFNNR